MKMNDMVVWLLQSKLYWLLGSTTMLLEATGRKTGRPVRLPVNLMREDGELWVISSRDRVWWRNLQANPQVKLWIEGRQVSAQAQLVLDPPVVQERLKVICTRQGWLARALGIRRDKARRLRLDDLQRVAAERLFVRLTPE